ncbi:MAG: tetratricopeptide repeat protein [Alphaproteobacteria bacterium]
MGKLSRGLALMLVVFGGLYAGLGQWLSVSRGPATTSFEALRRFAATLDDQEMALAASLGAKSLALVSADKRWGHLERAEFEYRAAVANESAGHTANALALSRMAGRELAHAGDADINLVINVARLNGDLALNAGNKLEAACVYGLALERLGPDRVAHPEQRLRPHPALEALTGHLIGLGKAFASARAAALSNESLPLTSCNLAADFYAERKDYAAAASISDAVLAQAQNDKTLGPEIRSALLQDAAHIAELNGQVDVAKARAARAVDVLSGDQLGAPRVVALENLATLHSNWSDAKGAEPYLQEAIKLREKLNGPDSPELVPPLLTLGYAHLDTKDASNAESLFKRALSIANAKQANNPSATLEATLALAELYDNQGRAAEAADMHSKAAALQKSGVTLRNADVEDVPIVEPSAKHRLALFDIPYLAGKTSGEITVGLSAGPDADWAGKWPARTFAPASENFAAPLVYAPRADSNADAAKSAAPSLFFVPGQGTDLSVNAGRFAHLQAMIGPGQTPLLVAWTDGDAVTESLRNDRAEAQGARALTVELARAAAAPAEMPLTLIAEGRGAFVALTALGDLPPAQRAVIDRRLRRIILIAPDIEAPLLTAELAHIDRSRTRTIIYAARTARPLLASAAIYGSHPVGLNPMRLSRLEGVETIETGIGTDWAGWGALWSDALVADIAHAIKNDSPAAKRCGIAHMAAAQTANFYILNPQGCAAPATN